MPATPLLLSRCAAFGRLASTARREGVRGAIRGARGRFPRNSGQRFVGPPLARPNEREVSGAASFRIVPRPQKPAFGVGAHSRLVQTGTEVGADEGGCSPMRARARCACRLSRISPGVSTPATPAIGQSRAPGVAVTTLDRRRHGDAHLWRIGGARRRAGRDLLSLPHGYDERDAGGWSCPDSRSLTLNRRLKA